MSPTIDWIRTDAGTWVPLGVVGAAPPAQFVLGKTIPKPTNTGFRVPEASLANYAGSFTNLAAGEKVTGLAISSHINLGGGDGPGTFEDCLVLQNTPWDDPADPGTATTYNAAQLWGAHGGTTFNHVEFRPNPAKLSHNTYGPQGGDMHFHRCKFRDMVDFIVFQGFTSGVGAARSLTVEGCYMVSPLWFAVDPRQGPEGSHPDNGQHMGNGRNLRWVGNYMQGGRTSCLLFGGNLQNEETGYDNVQVLDNWMLGDPDYGSTINFGADHNATSFPVSNITIKRNRLSTAGKTPGLLVRNSVRNLASTDLGLSSGGTGTPVLGTAWADDYECNVQLDPAALADVIAGDLPPGSEVLRDASGLVLPYTVSNGG